MTIRNEFGLTKKELMIAKYLTRGCTNLKIAEKTGLNVNTVKKCITSIFHKTGALNRTHATFLLHKLYCKDSSTLSC